METTLSKHFNKYILANDLIQFLPEYKKLRMFADAILANQNNHLNDFAKETSLPKDFLSWAVTISPFEIIRKYTPSLVPNIVECEVLFSSLNIANPLIILEHILATHSVTNGNFFAKKTEIRYKKYVDICAEKNISPLDYVSFHNLLFFCFTIPVQQAEKETIAIPGYNQVVSSVVYHYFSLLAGARLRKESRAVAIVDATPEFFYKWMTDPYVCDIPTHFFFEKESFSSFVPLENANDKIEMLTADNFDAAKYCTVLSLSGYNSVIKSSLMCIHENMSIATFTTESLSDNTIFSSNKDISITTLPLGHIQDNCGKKRAASLIQFSLEQLNVGTPIKISFRKHNDYIFALYPVARCNLSRGLSAKKH